MYDELEIQSKSTEKIKWWWNRSTRKKKTKERALSCWMIARVDCNSSPWVCSMVVQSMFEHTHRKYMAILRELHGIAKRMKIYCTNFISLTNHVSRKSSRLTKRDWLKICNVQVFLKLRMQVRSYPKGSYLTIRCFSRGVELWLFIPCKFYLKSHITPLIWPLIKCWLQPRKVWKNDWDTRTSSKKYLLFFLFLYL